MIKEGGKLQGVVDTEADLKLILCQSLPSISIILSNTVFLSDIGPYIYRNGRSRDKFSFKVLEFIENEGSNDLGEFKEWIYLLKEDGQEYTYYVRYYTLKKALIIGLKPKKKIEKTSTGEELSIVFSPLSGILAADRVVAFTPFCWVIPVLSTAKELDDGYYGSVIEIFNDNSSLVISSLKPLSNQLVEVSSINSLKHLKLGLEGLVDEIDSEVEVIVVFDRHPVRAFLKWGEILREIYGKKVKKDRIMKLIDYISYWTDNGAYYYYRTLPKRDYTETMISVKKYLEDLGLKVSIYEIDSWWYPKGSDGGAYVYKPVEEISGGLKALSEKLGPLIVHLRWLSKETEYLGRYRMNIEKAACPEDGKVFEEIAKYLRENGVVLAEQDWLTTIRFCCKKTLLAKPHSLDKWLKEHAEAFSKQGIGIIYCMPDMYHYLASLLSDNVLMIRTSDDYGCPLPRGFLIWQNFYLTILARALGLYSHFDVFLTSFEQFFRMIGDERPWPRRLGNPYSDILARELAMAPISIGDAIGAVSLDILSRVILPNGKVLRPDYPALPVSYNLVHNPISDKVPLIVKTCVKKEYLVLAFFNVCDEEIYYSFKPYEIDVEDELIFYNWKTGKVVRPAEKIEGNLELNDFDLWIGFKPESKPVILGSREYFLMPAALEFEEHDAGEYSIKVSHATELVIYTPTPPSKVEVDEEEVKYSYDSENNVIVLKLDPGTHNLRIKT